MQNDATRSDDAITDRVAPGPVEGSSDVNTNTTLLSMTDTQAFGVENPDGACPILFVSDHAGRAIPQHLGTLGLGEDELSRHIGYDIGIYGVTRELARALDATYIFQPYSRLVIDCNRKPRKPQSVPEISDGTVVPGNAGLTVDQIGAREDEILRPYQDRIKAELDLRLASHRPLVLFAMHSCTDRPRHDPRPRPWDISVIANSDWRIGNALVDVLKSKTKLCVGINEPYVVNMEMDYTIPVHAEGNQIPYVEIEIRQDLIGDESGQRQWASLLSDLFPKAVDRSGVLDS